MPVLSNVLSCGRECRSIDWQIGEYAMTKSQLIDQLANRIQLSRKEAEQAVQTVFLEIADALANRDRVELRGFGSFSVKIRPPREGRNPKTGEQVRVAEKMVPFFKAGKELRERVDN